MELGLSMGRRYVIKTIASIPEEALKEMRKHAFSPKRDKIQKFLIDNNYVITMTDKNLGLAVSERDWILRNELNLLEDERNYEELEFEVAQEVMKSKMIQMQTLARTVEDEHLFLFELGLSRFFLSNVPEDGSSFKYPQFHGIPKIHKKPTGFRPIIPCHSVVFNPAAKFVSKELKPIIKSTPSIIHGTKDLFTRLSQLRIDPQTTMETTENEFHGYHIILLDVKRGVYIGELSRLAVLCSTKEIYIGAIRDLNALYLMRGYPENLVMSWCKKNIQERWEKRFALRVAEHDESILVLKTRFDQVWNWFSAAELGKTVTEYWSAWYEHAEKGLYSADSSRPLIKPDPNYVHDLDDVRPELFTQILVDGETEFVPDLRKIGLLGSRWIVSRKRNTNLFDLANVWKKTVFRKLDENIAEKGGVVPETQNVNETYHSALVEAAEQISIESDNEIILHRRSTSQEREHPEFGRISKSYNR
ncbi:hypothetical protein JR316_0001558 [Psilocybe cubensis]|uniref:Uncharacterized protein n=2 Tax=Psilocybe cubensis TaxID=181762 RepID=A0A8H8CNM3_PSICU|nr:hypothetical protein JR316_0001558 [Psilocybe cubensis]KAH9484659.1 hypothetical protein JR316_0001558 [Psilocybe cubensis]